MEFRDYLMPGEHVLRVIKKVNINDGEFKNLVIQKKKKSLFSTSEEITKILSIHLLI